MDQVSYQCHWLRLVTKAQLPEVQDVMPGEWPVSSWDGPGGFNQKASVLSSAGVRVFHGNEAQPVVIECDGECVERNGHIMLAEAGRELGAWSTRCDLAADLLPAEKARHRLLTVRREFMRKRAESRLGLGMFMQNDEGCTQYIGSTKSELLVRLYDRRGPLRIEAQWEPKDKQMRLTLPMMLLERGPEVLWRSLASKIRLPCVTWWERLVEGDILRAEPAAPTDEEAERMIYAGQQQLGKFIWALSVGAVDVVKLLAVEPERPRGRDLRKFKVLAEWMKVNGHDGDALEEAIRCKSGHKQRR